MRILFWNTRKNRTINRYLVALIEEYDLDIIILAEYEDNLEQLALDCQTLGKNFKICNTIGSGRIEMLSVYNKTDPGLQDNYYSIQLINNEYIICGVHLTSDLYGDMSDERLEMSGQIMHDILELANEINSDKTIIVGDMNEMPFGKGCLSANGFHGLPVLTVEEKKERTVNSIAYRKFYNPMWNLFGDFTYPPGTYYYQQSKLYSPMWFMLDQFIISQSLLPELKKDLLKIVTTCKEGDLHNDKGIPDKKISDHFPIVCEIVDK